tara:strand:+ start:4215 stop:5831 length:1617 start_codon:yes stop_codon:yes gene_type:complete
MGFSLKRSLKKAFKVAVVAFFTAGIMVLTGGAAAFLPTFYVHAGLGLLMSALAPDMNMPTFGGGNKKNRGYNVTQTGSAMNHQIIYGKMKVGPVRVFDGTTGTDNVTLHRVIAFTGHEIDAYEQVYLNDELVTIASNGNVTSPSRFDGKVTLKMKLGSPDQDAEPTLVSAGVGYTNEHRLRGIAYMYARFEFDTDAFPNGVPEITAVIRGKKVFDPENPSAAPAWSDNPALCIRDYITESGYGLGEAESNVNDASFILAKGICNDTNTLASTKRFTCNGAFTTASTPQQLLEEMIKSCGAMLWYTQGQWNLKVAKYTTPVLTLDEDDLRSGLTVSTRHSRRDNFNTVQGTFRGVESNWQVTDFPPVTNADLLTIDGGLESSLDYDLPFCDNSIEARRLSRIMLERNRQQLGFSAKFGLRAFQLQVGDIVKITNTRLGFEEKEFQIVSWTFGVEQEYDLQIEMSLQEISENIFDEVDDGIVYEKDNTTLLSPFDVPTVDVVVEGDLRTVKGKAVGVMKVNVFNNSKLLDGVEVQYRKTP